MLDRSLPGRLQRSLTRILLGRPLANKEQAREKIGPLEGVPAMGLDGLGSSAYGPEAALSVLIPLGVAAPFYLGPIMIPTLALLAILYISYRQTIEAYPTSGGAYTVVKENIGTNASLLAAAALMIDYVLNVAVGISAGIAALVSAVPALHAHTLALCLGVLVLLTLTNLRGLLESGRALAIPTYTFVAAFTVLLAMGLYKTLMSDGNPTPVILPPPLPETAAAASLWLLLRAFASGCTAMTGVEAVSNGVGAFREPVVRHAHQTLTAIVGILAVLLAGIAYLANAYRIGAMDQTQPGYQSVLSQLAGAVVGHGVFYYVAIGSLLCVLALSANTSFTDFPRLCRVLAQDEFLPRPFAVVGRRLVFSVGILYLAVTSAVLLIVFNGITDRLIPLFAVGAFLTFTLSQCGMVFHWHRRRREARSRSEVRRVHGRLAINAVGAAATGTALAIIIAAKFTEGAWITVLVVPGVIVLLKSIKRYYSSLDQQIRDEQPLDVRGLQPPVVVVAIQDWNQLADKALRFALSLSPDVSAVHLTALSGPDIDEKEDELRARWKKYVEQPVRAEGLRPPPLELLQAPYRQIHIPLLKYLARLEAERPDRQVAVLIPEIVKRHWWEYLLSTRRAQRLRSTLLRYGGPRLMVINVPWHSKAPAGEDIIAAEEAA
jgi:amino acid transporter